MTATIIIIGVLLLPVIYNILFPFKPPNLNNYFKVGDTYSSKAEGITQTITKIIGNKIYCELKFEPHAVGPPEHLHVNFNETILVVSGTLTAKVGGEIKILHAGERVIFPKGIYHSMSNQSNEEVILRGEMDEDFVPVEFAYSLAQLYPLMSPDRGLTFKMFLKICVLDELFDSVPVGPPPAFFSIIKKVIKPYARLLGATPYDSRSNPN